MQISAISEDQPEPSKPPNVAKRKRTRTINELDTLLDEIEEDIQNRGEAFRSRIDPGA